LACIHRWPLVGVWAVLLALGAVGAISLIGSLSSTGWDVAGSGTVQVRQLLAEGFVGRGETTGVLVIHDRQSTAADPSFHERTRQVFDAVTGDKRLHAGDGFGWSTLGSPARDKFLGADRRTVVTSIGLGLDNDAATAELPKVQHDLVAWFGPEGLDVSLVNVQIFQGEINNGSVTGLVRAELVAMPLVVVVLSLLFRSAVAAMIAMATTMTGIVLTLGLLAPIAHHVDLSIFVANIVLMLGMGVGVDYSLLMIKRFKEELAADRDPHDAVTCMLQTAGRTVIASGVTIVVAMTTLFVVRLNAIGSLAFGAALVVAMSMLVAVLLLPVVLHIVGKRINVGRVWMPSRIRTVESATDTQLESHRWYRLAERVMDRPLLFLMTAVTVLVLLALPVANLNLSLPDARMLPESNSVGSGADRVAEQFGPGTASPIQVVIRSVKPIREVTSYAELRRFVTDVEALPHVWAVNSALPVLERVSPSSPLAALEPQLFDNLPPDARTGVRHYVSADDRKFVVEAVPSHRSADEQTRALLDRVRERAAALPPPLIAAVGGETSRAADVNDRIAATLPLVIGLMLVVLYIVLLVTFRSVFLPLKAIAMNIISLAATFGVLVMIFQYGSLAEWTGLPETGYLVSFVPLLVLAASAGLSTDYEVFLLSRVREHYLVHRNNQLAVASGLARTAPLITGAAVLMIVVFGAFGFASMMVTQQIGIGLAVAVALDATLIRIIVVPAAMRLMGHWNWWAPGEASRTREVGQESSLKPETPPRQKRRGHQTAHKQHDR
jgi:RND superfamily putative drug exporter